ncbi:hypothetical protein JG688_00015859 [Phytophthora aleatoria]|uniref:Uncharacterized protein n=1 Tax=Phytophthora aleatoria TaxID=2496075 RepID=A0A8J5LWK6_9STRA|nr:hypothetical protein JG688_00015859 [Phytophthora aleatoria]
MLGFALHPLYADTARQTPDTAVSGIAKLLFLLPPAIRYSSPQHGSVNKDEDSDDEDPGDNVDLTPTLSMWGDEVFEDNDIDTG